jgi:hypothetical protein
VSISVLAPVIFKFVAWATVVSFNNHKSMQFTISLLGNTCCKALDAAAATNTCRHRRKPAAAAAAAD